MRAWRWWSPALAASIDAGQDPATPEADERAEAVSVLTVHQSKGLEFSVVFVVGVAEGRFPVRARKDALALPVALTGRPAKGDPEAHRAEERRLFYVALTRARDELVLSHAAAGAKGGRQRQASSFLAEALGRPVEGPETGPELGLLEATDQAPPMPATPGASTRRAPLTLSFTQIDDYLTCPQKYQAAPPGARAGTAPPRPRPW